MRPRQSAAIQNQPLTLAPADAGYANPSGDHTVGLAQTSAAPDSGGIILTCVDPGAADDYTWEAYVFTGEGNSRRGLVVRADPANGFASNYQFVLESGMLQIRFRKLVDSAPTTLGTWLTTETPGGFPSQNTWHHMKVIANANTFRCFWDGFELTSEATPIEDSQFAGGWAGVYNFRFDIGFIAFLVDDLILSVDGPNAARATSWGKIKASYR